MPVTNSSQGVLPGIVQHFAANTAPAGWMKANGALVSRTTYAALYLAIGTVYGVGNGSTTFGLPDLRGEFLRGWDDARGIDVGRAIGTTQTQDMQPHTHNSQGTDGGVVGASTPVRGNGGGGAWTYATTSAGTTETRPRNVAMLACIKF